MSGGSPPSGAVDTGRDTAPSRSTHLGAVAGVGARVAAFTIDMAAVAAIATVVGVASASVLLAVLATLEALVALWVVQGRTGTSIGKALLRLRVTRADAPFSPGVGRAFVRGLISAMGAAVLGVGAWLVEASAAWDRGPRRRSWADRAAQTVVVAVPRRHETDVVMGTPDNGATVLPTPTVRTQRGDGIAGRAAIAPVIRRPDAAPALITSTPRVGGVISAAPTPVVDTLPGEVTGGDSGGSTGQPGPRRRGVVPWETDEPAADPSSGELLLAFDTGQRAQLPVPVAVNLGRRPEPTAPGDELVVVRDPDGTVSKTHARLEHTRAGTWITDVGSTNGTDLLDEEGHATPVLPGARTQVEDGVRVRLGDRVFTVSRLLGDSD
ncbi:RDD family protein [uncultured Microbacterium sp.]|uniref:RDD family protein n=1 Tax=uncultured Microbacterium sp. TaxID=191216 RepID=UPI00258BFE28|nr:RDD family protein [uncultured Microbacterium sp.]